MDVLYKLQNDKMNIMEKARINFKKSPKERITRSYIETRLESLESSWNCFLNIHSKIIQSATDENQKSDLYFRDNVYDLSEELYIVYKSELKEVLQIFNNSKTKTEYKETKEMLMEGAKLPKINIPLFSGNYIEWTSFKDLYSSLIHNNSSLDEVQKMHYLKGLLSGEAEQLVRHIPIAAGNYLNLWNFLNHRYNNKRFIANGLLKRLMCQPNASETCTSIMNLLDTTMECLNGLKNLEIDVTSWDLIIIYITCLKLDSESRKLWEAKISVHDELPKLSEFKEFLESRFRSLEFLDTRSSKNKPNVNVFNKPRVHHIINSEKTNVEHNDNSCAFCKGVHYIGNCKLFAKESYESRLNFVKTHGLCFNCLRNNHSIKYCRQYSTCRICRKKHHSLLHAKPVSTTLNSNIVDEKKAISTIQGETSQSSSTIVNHFVKRSTQSQVLLATALVEAQTRAGAAQLLRVLLDQGSQASFITESAAQLLGLKKIPNRSIISGLSGEKTMLTAKCMVIVRIQSRLDPSFSLEVQAYVLNTITSLLPVERVPQCNWPELEALTLADPDFHTPSKIDMLLGAETYGHILREGIIHSSPGLPVAQNTVLGWILSGKILKSHEELLHCHHSYIVSSEDKTDENAILKKFWEIESVLPCSKKIFSEEEQWCENIYQTTTHRDKDGRYVVNLPFRDIPRCQHGNSKELALKRFQYLENKFKKNPNIKQRYSEVMHEYLDLGHMEHVSSNQQSSACYLPHHAVVREDKSTTKVRVVFDASMKGSNGVSLNDDLMVGPTLQPPLRHIIMQWRSHPISLCADIVKMYRQVKVTSEHVDFQRILWRDDPQSEIKEYKLLRVTFGTASAPYLAVKTLQQVAVDECADYPEIAERINNHFFVDDLMSGCQNIKEGKDIYIRMSKVLTKAGFQLQKWVSSSSELHREISEIENGVENEGIEIQGNKDIKIDETIRILGISWNREEDEFRYSVNLPQQEYPVTKRRVISDISRLFDPLGWAAPCVVMSKMFIQKLWLSGIDWDAELSEDLQLEWQTYRNNLLEISKFSIPRWINTRADDISVELHGFSDASVSAYAAVIYIRVVDRNSNIHTNLVTSRTKVSPVKQVSIPRLELMGATLLSELITEVAEVLKIPQSHIHAWTDSSIVLAWLSSHPSRWSTFVGNRVSAILSVIENSNWAHVQSVENPADVASRGLTPQELSGCTLWTQGPSWLKNENIQYTRPKAIATTMELKSIKTHLVCEERQEDIMWTKFSTLQRMLRVIAYCRRVLKWKKHECQKRYEDYLTKDEIEEATKICIKYVQNKEFVKEIKSLHELGIVKGESKLKPLCPIIDSDGIIRVGGRIQKGNMDVNFKHPIILPHSNHFTELIIKDSHDKTLHGGPTLMLNYLRTKYWIISAKTLVKACVRKCVTCKRFLASNKTQFMGQLPSSRVIPARAFRNCGVDFAGPVDIRTSKGRGHQSYKGYICLFICMATKAIHLEAISDLSAQGFLAGFKRFVSRRGQVSDIWSDNGTNFVGAAKELKHLVAAEKSTAAADIREWLGNNGTRWHFIPPRAPNFGGLWEAGVKSTKFHLKRVIGVSTLTYEEMSTVLTQVEACLNSRPLSMLPDDPNGFIALTPGHFLIGEPLMTVPDRSFENINIGSLRRWQLFVAASPQLAAISAGGLIGFPSVLLQQFKSNESSIHVDVHTASWIASIHGLAGIPSLFIPYIMQHRGRKFGFHTCCLLVILGWTIIYFARNATTIIIGESFQGLGAKSMLVVSYMTISEMVHPKYRNILMLLYSINQTVGVTLVHTMGRFIHWKTISIIMAMPVMFAFLLSCAWPESPAWLALKGKFDECKKSFIWLRGTKEDAMSEMNSLINAQIVQKNTQPKKSDKKEVIKDFFVRITSRDFYLPSFHMFVLLSVYYCSGNLVFLVYAMNMIENVTKDENSAFIGMIVMDCVTMLGNSVAYFLFKYFNNKPILLTSGVGSAIFLLASSVVSYLQFINLLPADSLLCLYLLVGFMIASSLGIYTTPYVMSAEIMPVRHRGIGGSLMVIIICASYSTTLKIAPYLVLYLKLHGTFLLYTLTLSVCLFWVWKFVPETKNKTLQCIEECYTDKSSPLILEPQPDEQLANLNVRLVLIEKPQESSEIIHTVIPTEVIEKLLNHTE